MERNNAFDVDNHFKTKIQLLKFFSSWWTKPSTLWVAILEKCLSVIRIALLMVASVGQIIQLTKMANLKGASEVVEMMTFTTSASYKSVFFLYHQKKYVAMLDLMRSSFLERPMLLAKSQKHTNMTKFLAYTDLFAYAYIFSASFLVTINVLAIIFFPDTNPQPLSFDCNPNLTLAYCEEGIEHNLNSDLPLKIWLPVDYSWTPFHQIIILVTGFVWYDCCLLYASQDIFFFTLLYAVCGQFQILEESLTNLGKLKLNHYKETGGKCSAVQKFEERNGSLETLTPYVEIQLNNEQKLDEMLRGCVQQHILLLKLLRDFEKLMGIMIIVDFLHAITSLSFALLEISVTETMIYAIRLLGYISICVLHQFMNNFFGEMVIQKQLRVSQVVYALPWEEYPKKLKSSILLMQLRSEQPIVINGFKMYFLCYSTFVDFMKAIISYYTVLRNVHLEN